MKIVYVSNYLNHHQVNLADELWQLTGGSYRFVAETDVPQERIALGYKSFANREYLIVANSSAEARRHAERIILDADIVIFGHARLFAPLMWKRLQKGALTLETGERWLKRGFLNLLSPRIIHWLWNYHVRGLRPAGFLGMSAYAATDFRRMRAFRNRCFRWGYFPIGGNQRVLDSDALAVYELTRPIKILYIGRLLDWKQVDIAIRGVDYLSSLGKRVELNIYGLGPEESHLRQLVSERGLGHMINFYGSVPSSEVPGIMQRHHCMVFCSNKREGWGAVVNEAMANGCTVIGNSEAGSVPFLIRHGENGLIFNNSNQDEFNACLDMIVDDISFCRSLAVNALKTVNGEWSASSAARRLLLLVDFLRNPDVVKLPESGPCSLA